MVSKNKNIQTFFSNMDFNFAHFAHFKFAHFEIDENFELSWVKLQNG